MRRWAALVVLALALTGCETTAEKSARLERAAKRARADNAVPARRGLSIARPSTVVRVLGTALVHDSEGAAVVVRLRSASSHALRDVPIAITVRDAHGRTLFRNDAAGLEAALVSVPSIAAHGELAWVNDQVPASGGPASVSARVGEAPPLATAPPALAVEGTRLVEEPSTGVGASGTVDNRSAVTQHNVVVFGVASRAGRVVAAGRGVVPELAAGESKPFQVFFVGDPHGAQLKMSAPATTFG